MRRLDFRDFTAVPCQRKPVPPFIFIALTPGEIEEKFSMCVKGKLSEKEKKKLIDWVDHLEEVEKLQKIRIGKALLFQGK